MRKEGGYPPPRSPAPVPDKSQNQGGVPPLQGDGFNPGSTAGCTTEAANSHPPLHEIDKIDV
ncbi:hypothetical protein PG996_013870 [Apiospora saccharicola]|uniref:Uncharacterized protein n=1 Tax=Apiospora saccharicola TaxID=335842 RepID=A0ABR1TGN9_9PEZI